VLTGAGVSAESGIPTFRDALEGLWKDYDPEELATEAGFRRNPELVWRWYRQRRLRVGEATPNAGHHALVRMESLAAGFSLITQNVDGLHARAGQREVIELHGNLARVKCADCGRIAAEFEDGDSVPRCHWCGGPLRPDVVWFGELLPRLELARAESAARRCELFLSVGTSNLVEPAASLPWEAASSGATVVVINTTGEGQRRGPNVHLILGKAGEILPRLVRAAWPERVVE
jgi:NAD-dependent deacetylase